MQQGQIWRFITPVFLHVGFSHVIFNCITQLLFGSMLEGMIGFKQTAAIYIASGIGGNLFSAVCQNGKSVGASTADFGILTGLLSMIFVNWKAFDGNSQLETARCMLLFMIIFMIVINLLMGAAQAGTVDSTGHIGGALCGLFWGFAFFPRVANPTAIKLKKVAPT